MSSRRLLFALFLIVQAMSLRASSFVATQSGNWSSPATWGGFGVPGAGDTATVGGVTVTVDSPVTIATFTFLSGVINGANTLTITSTCNWDGGIFDSGGPLAIQASAQLNIETAANHQLSNSYAINNSGTTHWTGGGIILDTSALISNLAGALFSVECDGAIYQTFYNGSFSNAGTFRKVSGSGLTHVTINVQFANSGTIDIQSGTFTADALTLNTGTVISGTGLVVDTGGTTNVAGSANVPSGHSMDFAGGTITGAGTLTISGTLNWKGGAFDSGTGSTNIASGGVLNLLTGASDHQISTSSVVNNSGTVHWYAGNLLLNNSGTFNNLAAGVFSDECDCTIYQSFYNGTFTNAGIFRKTVAIGLTHSTSGVPFINNGQIDIQTGTFAADQLMLNNGSTITGSGFLVSGGTTTVAGSAAVPSGSSIGVSGGTVTGAGVLTISGTLNWTNGIFDSGTGYVAIATGGQLNIQGVADHQISGGSTIKSTGGTTHWTGGRIILNNGAFFENLSGVFSVECACTITNSFYNGTFKNAGTFRKSIGSGLANVTVAVPFDNIGTIDITSGTFTADTLTLNNGSIVTGTGLIVNTGGTTTVAGTSSLPAGSSMTLAGGIMNGAGTLTVKGTFNWTGGAFDATTPVLIDPAGALSISGAADKFIQNNGGLTSAGTTHWTAGRIILDNGGLFTNQSGALFSNDCDCTVTNSFYNGSFSNAGTFRKAAGSGLTHVTSAVPFINSGRIEVPSGTFTADQLALNSGSVIAGTGFTIDAGGTTTVNGTASVPTGESASFAGGTLTGAGLLTVSGTFNWSGGAIDGTTPLQIASAGMLNILGTADKFLQNNGGLNNAGTAHWTDGRIILNTGGLLTNQAGALFSNDCDCTITNSFYNGSFSNAGTFRKTAGSGLTHVTAAVPFLNSGRIDVPSGTFTADQLTLNNGTTLTGTGFLVDAGGTMTVAGSASVPALDTIGFAGGTINGAGLLTVNGTINWTGGNIDGTAPVLINTAGILNLAGGGDKFLTNNGTLNTAGTTHWTAGRLILNTGGLFNNQAGALFSVECDSAVTNSFYNGSFTNAGTFKKVLTTGTTTISGIPFDNSGGKIDITAGIVSIASYTNNSSSTVDVTLGGTTPGSGFGQLDLPGNPALAGFLHVSLKSGYTPSGGDTYQIVTLPGGHTGDFTKSYAPLPSGEGWASTYNAAGLLVSIITCSTPTITPSGATSFCPGGSVTLTSSPALSYLWSTGATTQSITVNASGSYTVTVTDAAGCSATAAPAVVTVYTPPAVTISPSGPTTFCSGSNVTLTASGATSYLWSNGAMTNSITVSASGTFTVTGTDTNGCSSTSSPTTVTVNPTPAFTITAPGSVNANGTGYTASASPAAPMGSSYVWGISGGTITAGNGTQSITFSAASGSSLTITLMITTSGCSATQSSTVTVIPPPNADLQVTKSGPPSVTASSQITYHIVVTNNGPASAANVTLTDNAPSRLTLTSLVGACSTLPCNLGTMTANQTKTIDATYAVQPGAFATITNTASVTSAAPDLNTANNSSSVSTIIGCPTAPPSNLRPANGLLNVPTSGFISWSGNGAASYNVYLGKAGVGCNQLLGTTSRNALAYVGLEGATDYEFRVESVNPGCNTLTSECVTFRTANTCTAAPPSLIAPAPAATAFSPVQLSWSAVTGASSYVPYVSINGAAFKALEPTTSTSAKLDLAGVASISWFVVATVPNCGEVTSATGTFSLCNIPPAPVASVVGLATTGQTYQVSWNAINGASSYEIDEATNDAFNNRTTKSVTTTSVSFKHDATSSAQLFFYRVRAVSACGTSAYSEPVRIVIMPLPAKGTPNPNVTAPAGSIDPIVQRIFVHGFADGTYTFTATVDKSWLRVEPDHGTLPPDGIELEVIASPEGLLNGTSTGTVIVTTNRTSSGTIVATAASTVSVPVSINLVTPVTPVSKTTPITSSLIIPSVGHLDGASSRWQSDVRITNTSSSSVKYQLLLTLSGAATKQTSIDAAANTTIALDDIVSNWYGVGAAGDGASGVLEIRPPDAASALATVASSRTFNVASNGTLGQFIPAVRFSKFIGSGGNAALSLQQLAQSAQFRTNVGIVEAAGQPLSGTLSVFNSAGSKVLAVPIDLKAAGQLQLNSLLAQNNLSLSDARIEVRPSSGGGKVTAYASVIDNQSGDPLLVSGAAIGSMATRWVLPGVADLDNGFASWRTDVRVFNGGASTEQATVEYFPQGSSTPMTASLSIAPGEVKAVDSILQSLFGVTNSGGAIHLTTAGDAPLIVTGKTYNQTSNGTLGQFISAVTPADGTLIGGRALEISQLESSVRYRTNVGIAEINGAPATVQLSVTIPDSKVTPRVEIPLQANEFRQFDVFGQLGLTNAYNARVTIKVISGSGVVSAYGSVIDQTTQDPTYVPAQ